MRNRVWPGFIAGFVTAAVLFGGVVAGAAGFERQITAYFRPLNYVFDGLERQPPADQQGFVYNGRTYVPLRFMAESLGRPVQWDDATGTIYVGAVPAELPAIWAETTQHGDGTFKVQHFTDGALSADGVEMPDATVVSLIAVAGDGAEERQSSTSQLWAEYTLPEGASRLTGTLYMPLQYFGVESDRRVGRITVLNELNQAIYTSPDLTAGSDAVPFDVPLTGVRRIRLVVTLYPYYGVPVDDKLVMTQVGISGLRID